jgi:hypothetical protein
MTTFSQYELEGTPGPGKKEPLAYKDWAHLFLFIILVLFAALLSNIFSDGGRINTIIETVLVGGALFLAIAWMAKMYFREVDEREYSRGIMSIVKSIKRHEKKKHSKRSKR